MSNVTGKLSDATRVRFYGGGYFLVGIVTDDQRGRFPDGSKIHTSLVLAEEGGIITTANSFYEVLSWRNDDKPALAA